MLGVAADCRRIGERHDRVPVLARVIGKVLAAQLAALPAEIEGMVEDVPACPRFVDSINQIHLAPFTVGPLKNRSYASRSMPATARAKAPSSKR